MSWFPSYEKIKENAPMIIGGVIGLTIGWTIGCITSIDHNVHTINTKLDIMNKTLKTGLQVA